MNYLLILLCKLTHRINDFIWFSFCHNNHYLVRTPAEADLQGGSASLESIFLVDNLFFGGDNTKKYWHSTAILMVVFIKISFFYELIIEGECQFIVPTGSPLVVQNKSVVWNMQDLGEFSCV